MYAHKKKPCQLLTRRHRVLLIYVDTRRLLKKKWKKARVLLQRQPKNQPTRTTTLETLKDLDVHFNSCVKIRLRNINPEATDADWMQLTAPTNFAALYPEYSDVDQRPESYTVYLLPSHLLLCLIGARKRASRMRRTRTRNDDELEHAKDKRQWTKPKNHAVVSKGFPCCQTTTTTNTRIAPVAQIQRDMSS